MSRREKLIEKIRARPPEADFSDVRRLLEMHGWTLDRERGSHAYFVNQSQQFSVPRVSGRKVKRTYLDKICTLLDLD